MDNAKLEQQIAIHKDLSTWCREDVRTTTAWDRIFLPVVMIGCGTTFVKYPDAFAFAYGGGLMILLFWLLHCWRHRSRMRHRFNVIKQIEQANCLKGHSDVPEPSGLSNIAARISFVAVAIVLGCIVTFKFAPERARELGPRSNEKNVSNTRPSDAPAADMTLSTR